MSKGQQRHIEKWYDIQTLKYYLKLQFKISERNYGRNEERSKEKIRKKM